ncbi:MAG: class II fructose-bisphosphate aldolase [Candidatus Sungbacteria bacterium]|uniref:Class II fructose-bisphosphate aldolase n=1 Tax=Candidatus Sungiibacteriota bacterium TaxID=2750080 RepID=A0A931YDL4_9BACT|nr:class II fructose-bisphosphate aldolase [Candidatus Sungbacteria bacterium]
MFLPMTLKEILIKASKESWAVGHFNVSNLELLKAVVEAAKEAQAPVMIGTSEGEREWLGLKNMVALIKVYRQDWPSIFLNADHTKNIEAAFDAIEAGYDSVHFDASNLSISENIRQTREVVEYARSKNINVSVEGELGYLKGESQLSNQKIKIDSSEYTDPEEAAEFAERTGIDRLAIAIGNVHGINLDEPRLDFDRLRKIRAAVPENVALVLHAGSGIPDADIKHAIESGIGNIHISTELRVLFKQGLEQSMKSNPGEYALYKLEKEVVRSVQDLIRQKLRLFGSVGRV